MNRPLWAASSLVMEFIVGDYSLPLVLSPWIIRTMLMIPVPNGGRPVDRSIGSDPTGMSAAVTGIERHYSHRGESCSAWLGPLRKGYGCWCSFHLGYPGATGNLTLRNQTREAQGPPVNEGVEGVMVVARSERSGSSVPHGLLLLLRRAGCCPARCCQLPDVDTGHATVRGGEDLPAQPRLRARR